MKIKTQAEGPGQDGAIAAQVQADVAAMTFGREPVIEAMPASQDDLTRQWNMLSERIRRGIISSPDTRQAMASLVNMRVSETLPDDAVRLAGFTDAKVAKGLGRVSRLGSFLSLPSVPDKAIAPDITYAPSLVRPESVAYSLTQDAKRAQIQNSRLSRRIGRFLGIGPKRDTGALYELTKRRYAARAPLGKGLGEAERELVALRYRYAREVKLLALMAELADEPGQPEDMGDGTVGRDLKSGVKMVLMREAADADPNILNPASWQSRRVIKDRVHAVVIGGKEYIMKERKTARHTDTAEDGHVDGVTSKEEFEAARHFAGLGIVQRDGISLHWERPVGYAEFPDGFSFCLFESEPDLARAAKINSEGLVDTLAEAIMQKPELYSEEFQRVKDAAKEIWDRDETRFLRPWKQDETRRLAKMRHGIAKAKAALGRSERPIKNDDLTFQEFAFAKAIAQQYLAKKLLKSTIAAEGYVNTDSDGDALRVISKPGEKPVLDVTLFDFERYDRAEKYSRQGTSAPIDIDTAARFDGLFVERTVEGVRSIRTAAVFALLQQAGIPLKNQA